IGAEKAGIMRRGRPVVVGDADPPASLAAHAAQVGAHLLAIGRDFRGVRDGQSWRVEGPGGARHDSLPLVQFGGAVQSANMAACVAVVDALQDKAPVDERALRAGLAQAHLRGRTERHVRGGVEWIFDVAHNPSAARVLREAVEGQHASRTLAVFAAMEDKDLEGVLEPFAALVDRWHVSRPDSERGAPLAAVARVLRALGVSEPILHEDVPAACRAALAEAKPGERVLVFGSFYTVGPALEALGLYSTPLAVRD